jgi:hypothetical protein
VADASDYISSARNRIIEILDAELAVVHPELEARISEAVLDMFKRHGSDGVSALALPSAGTWRRLWPSSPIFAR